MFFFLTFNSSCFVLWVCWVPAGHGITPSQGRMTSSRWRGREKEKKGAREERGEGEGVRSRLMPPGAASPTHSCVSSSIRVFFVVLMAKGEAEDGERALSFFSFTNPHRFWMPAFSCKRFPHPVLHALLSSPICATLYLPLPFTFPWCRLVLFTDACNPRVMWGGEQSLILTQTYKTPCCFFFYLELPSFFPLFW
jgi:hypothetical protein